MLCFFVCVFFFFFRKNTGTQLTISLDFTTVMSFYLLRKHNKNKDGFYLGLTDLY